MANALISKELRNVLLNSGREELLAELTVATADHTPRTPYFDMVHKIHEEGIWITNERTGVRCKTIIGCNITIDVANNRLPLDTTNKAFTDMAFGELLGYIRGEVSSDKFEELKARTWHKNANENKAWLNNPNRRGENDMGMVYGAVGNSWPELDWAGFPFTTHLVQTDTIDLLQNIVDDLSRGVDNRGEIWSFWNPGMFSLGCLRPCMFMHAFCLRGDGTLDLFSTQRSCDWLLGVKANLPQCHALLQVIAQITGNKPGNVYWTGYNNHIYEDQYDIMLERGHLEREEIPCHARLEINPEIKTLEDLRTWATPADFKVVGYECHPEYIKYPMQE